MKLLKLTDNHFIIVDESTAENAEYCCHLVTKNIVQQENNSYYNDWKKITHSSHPFKMYAPLTINDMGLGYLPLHEVKELIGESISFEKGNSILENNWKHKNWLHTHVDACIIGYEEALKDTKVKQFTDEDVASIIFDLIRNTTEGTLRSWEKRHFLSIIQEKIKQPTEWQVEWDEKGNLKLK